MDDIYNIFITKTIKDILDSEMPEIRFVFDEKTLKELESYLNKEGRFYQQGLESIQYLYKVRQQWLDGEDDIFIIIHNSAAFFSLLQELIEVYSQRTYGNFKLLDSRNFIRSIWLRMSPADIDDVEYFLKKQLTFLKNASRIHTGPKEFMDLGDNERLVSEIFYNEEWFETNTNIIFSIIQDIGMEKDFPYLPIELEYKFPAIHFELAKKEEKLTCFIYGIQNISRSLGKKDNDIKEKLKPLRKKFRNSYVSADFIIVLGLFFDYLYNLGFKNIEIPTLQCFNYTYHENISSMIIDDLARYSEEEKNRLEQLCKNGVMTDEAYEYWRLKKMYSKFGDKQDLISKNKTERFLHTVFELINHYPSIEIVSEAFVQSENMIIHLNGPLNILDEELKKERTMKN